MTKAIYYQTETTPVTLIEKFNSADCLFNINNSSESLLVDLFIFFSVFYLFGLSVTKHRINEARGCQDSGVQKL